MKADIKTLKNKATGKRGLIKTILIIVIALLVVSYFGINLRQLASEPTTQDNFSYAATTTVSVWQKYLRAPVTYVWHEVFVNLIWNPAIDHLKEAPLK